MKRRNFIASAAALAAAPALIAEPQYEHKVVHDLDLMEVNWDPPYSGYYVQKRCDTWLVGLHNPEDAYTQERYDYLKQLAMTIGTRYSEKPTLHIGLRVAASILILDSSNFEVPVAGSSRHLAITDLLYAYLFQENECTMTTYAAETHQNLLAFTVGMPLGNTLVPPPLNAVEQRVYKWGLFG